MEFYEDLNSYKTANKKHEIKTLVSEEGIDLMISGEKDLCCDGRVYTSLTKKAAIKFAKDILEVYGEAQ